MDNDLRQIELVTARTRLEREQLMLQNERDKRRRVEAAISTGKEVAGVAADIGTGVVNVIGVTVRFTLRVIVKLFVGAAFGLAVCSVLVLFGAGGNVGGFQYRLGFFLGGDGWIVVAVCCFVSLTAVWGSRTTMSQMAGYINDSFK